MSSVPAIAAVAPAIVMRDIAHDLRQPLSAIESIAYYLTLVMPRQDLKIQDQLGRLQELVEQSDWILGNGLHLTEPIIVAAELVDFEGLITEVLASRSWPGERAPRLELADNLAPVRIDPGLGRVLIGNLLMLFRQLATDLHPPVVRTSASENTTAFEMETTAPGYRSETTLGPGGILSLTCARRIAEAHGGSLECVVDPITGIRVRVMLP